MYKSELRYIYYAVKVQTASAFCFGEGLVRCQSMFIESFYFLNEGKGGLFLKGDIFYVSPELK